MKFSICLASAAVALTFLISTASAETTNGNAVVSHYAELVHANYVDSLTAAEAMDKALESFAAAPTDETLAAAKEAWIAARKPYLQTEVFRFYAGPIDDDDGPEGLLNAWPMDEAYLDYVEGAPAAGLINDADTYPEITAELITELNEKDGEENVSTGFHAIEFLLWGQDLSEDGPGARPVTDFTTAENADRRKTFLLIASDLLLDHLSHLVTEWNPDLEDNYRAEFLAASTEDSLEKILTGISMLSGFELSGERMLVALETRAQEDEHSCFSDTTHFDIVYNALGIVNVWTGNYQRIDGTTLEGPGVSALAEQLDSDLAKSLQQTILASYDKSLEIPAPFDQILIAPDDATSRQAVEATITSLEDQAELVVALSKKLGFEVPISE